MSILDQLGLSARAERDLAYLREVADLGVRAPLLSGGTLVWWGALLASAYALQAASLSGWNYLPRNALSLMWLATMAFAWTGQVMLWRTSSKPGGGSMGNRVFAATWRFSGAVVTAIGCSLMAAAGAGVIGYEGFPIYTIMCFATYGVAFWLLATIGRQDGYKVFALLAFTASVGLVWFAATPIFYALAAIVVLLVVVAPGILMLHARIKHQS